jgi:hypothetical protein
MRPARNQPPGWRGSFARAAKRPEGAPGVRGHMKDDQQHDPIEHLISLLARMPGMGRRSARRAVLRMLMRPGRRCCRWRRPWPPPRRPCAL